MRKLLILLVMLAAAASAQVTPNLGLNTPTHGAPNWDVLLNANFVELDTLLACYGTASTPGTIAYYTGSAWACFPGNTAGNMVLQESSTGVPSWATNDSAVWGGITGTLSNQTDLQTALNLKANLASPALTGTPTAPTAAPGTNTTQLATTAYVLANVANATATYYVSPLGSDLNNGTSPTTPWQTIAKVNASTINPGDTVLFLRNGTWREQLLPPSSGVATAYIKFGAYGAGLSPVISGADLLTTWTAAAPAYYSASASVSPGSVLVDGISRLTKNTTSIVSLVVGEWFWDSGTSRVYLRLIDDSNPSLHTVEGTQRAFAIRNTRSFLSFSDLSAKGTTNVGHYENGSTNTVITGETADWNDVNGMLLRGGWVSCTNCTAGHNKVHGIATDDAASGSHDITLNNPVTNFNTDSGLQITDTVNVTINGGESAYNGTATVEGNGVSVSSLSGVNVTNLLVNNFNSHDNLGNGFSSVGDNTPSGATGIVITGGRWCNNATGVDPSSGIRFDTRTTLSTVQYAIACNNTSGGIVMEDNATNNRALYNLVYGNNDGLAQTNGTGAGNVWYGNVSYGNTNSGFIHQTGTPAGAVVKNNILMNNAVYGYRTDGTGVADTVDYNDVFGNGTNYSGIAAPTHDIQLDPLFVDAANANFYLRATSPAINAGIALASPFDLGIAPNTSPFLGIDQNVYGASWEMGAYVYVGALPVVNLAPTVKLCGTTTTCAKTLQRAPIVVYGTVALSSGTPSTATLTALPFSATGNYVCTGSPVGATAVIAGAGVAFANASASSTVLTGPDTVTTVIDYTCVGN